MNAFFTALSFLTRIPVPLRSQPGSWSRSVRYYPAVGLVIGGMLAGFDLVAAAWFPPWVRGVLLLGLWVWLTGGLHLDGWMDTADGFGSYRPRERTLEIMKDSRVGAMGVIAAILLLLLKASALASTPGPLWIPLLAAPVIGRWALLPAIRFCPYLTQDGIGKGLREGLTPVSMAAATLFTLLVTVGSAGIRGLWFLVIPLVLVLLLGRAARKRLGGWTGDMYGALVEATEAGVLLLWLLLTEVWL
ncbi:adenosylcobinamide-GDP ribazoletransferase [Kroppenstedtia eburnea]|uniref:adenosylcobinamide-GDP ribazoletransferase n=1 Tax=Kroppenstedtia eburnea TaxID=714067 RepID=UPI00362CACFC